MLVPRVGFYKQAVSQGSAWIATAFIYINERKDGIVLKISKFPSNTKLSTNVASSIRLQWDLCLLNEWLNKQQIPFNVTYCKSQTTDTTIHKSSTSQSTLENKVWEKGLEVIISKDLKFTKQSEVNEKLKRNLGYIKQQLIKQ